MTTTAALKKLKNGVTVEVAIDSIEPWPNNPRVGDVDGIAKSIARFGQVRALVVQKSTGRIVAGNQTYAALKQLDHKTVEVKIVDMDDATARAFVVADNRLADVATYDDQLLVQTLQEVLEDGGLEGTGFEVDDVEDLVAALGQVPPADDGRSGARHVEDDDETRQRYAGHQEGQMREIVLLMPDQEASEFRDHVQQLKEAWELDQAWQVVKTAVQTSVDGLAP